MRCAFKIERWKQFKETSSSPSATAAATEAAATTTLNLVNDMWMDVTKKN